MPRKGDVQVYGPTILTTNDDGDRNIYIASSAGANSGVPQTTDGQDGDVWFIYTP